MTQPFSPPNSLAALSATAAAEGLAAGQFSARELVQACLDQCAAQDSAVEAWTVLDPDAALEQADQADRRRSRGEATGGLHGIPIGIKDIIDTKQWATECGTILYQGRRCSQDAVIVSRLKAAGAVMMGKTVTTEFAVYAPGKTRNPHNPEHTPGGSSSGSAAAVASSMVPLALGSQTNGSMIRPASYCGVFGFKPSFGLIPRGGVLRLSSHLDHLGVFARSVEDCALIADSVIGWDGDDESIMAAPRSDFTTICASEMPIAPRFAWVPTRHWDRVEESARSAFSELASCLGERMVTVALPESIENTVAAHKIIMDCDIAYALKKDYERGGDKMSAEIRAIIERGQAIAAVDYLHAKSYRLSLQSFFADLFADFDAIITPAALGEAPQGLATTGDPIMATLWTLAGLPSLSIPLLTGGDGLPVGVQLVGAYRDDARLLRTARHLLAALKDEDA